jgi:hypothetical protein
LRAPDVTEAEWVKDLAISVICLVSVSQPVQQQGFSGLAVKPWPTSTSMEVIMPRNKLMSFVGVALLASVNVLQSFNPARADDAADIRKAFLDKYEPNQNLPVLEALNKLFRQFDPFNEGLTEEKLAYAQTLARAQKNAESVGLWLYYDLNADLKIDRNEAQTQFTAQVGRHNLYRRHPPKKRRIGETSWDIEQLFLSDLDSNGVIEGPELHNMPFNAGVRFGLPQMEKDLAFAKAILAADPNNDGVVSESEAALLVAGALQDIEEDIANLQLERQQLQDSMNCKKFDVAENTRFVVLGAEGGNSLSTVSLAGQNDVTYAATVFVEAGAEPLTLMLSSGMPMIWKLSGATQRLSKVILAGPSRRTVEGTLGKPAVGAIGIDKSKITFFDTMMCYERYYNTRTLPGIRSKPFIEILANRPVDVLLVQKNLTVAAIPSGAGLQPKSNGQDEKAIAALVAKTGTRYFSMGVAGKLVPLSGEGPPSFAEVSMTSYHPFAVMDFKPEEILTDAKPETYAVLPERSGLAQLQGEGKIRLVTDKHVMWTVKNQIRYPAGLYEKLATSFFVPKGVPLPNGNPGDSCIFSEDNGEVPPDGPGC